MTSYTKYFILAAVLAGPSIVSFAQKDTLKKEIFHFTEQMATFNGDLSEYLTNNLQYPAAAMEAGQQGTTLVEFIVNEDGSVSDAKVLSSSGYTLLDNEALRVASALPNFIPARQRGVPVAMYYKLPVTFALDVPQDTPAYEPSDIMVDSVRAVEEPAYDYTPPPAVEEEMVAPAEEYIDAPENVYDVDVEAAPATAADYSPLPKRNIKDLKIEAKPDQAAAYESGMTQLFRDVNREVQYPYNYGNNYTQGYVIIKFVITADKQVCNAEVTKSLGYRFDNAALDVLRTLKYNWVPAQKNGKAVSSYYYLPVRFQYKKQSWEE